MATQVKSPQISDYVENSSMYRQGLINGNMDIVQRITPLGGVALATYSPPLGTLSYFLFDRWKHLYAVDGGTPPSTWTLAQVAITPGQLPGSFYQARMTTNGAGSGYGANSGFYLDNAIENGNRFYAGSTNRYVTVSFWARSSIANKRIGIALFQNYGSGGSPTALEPLTGEVFTLTSSWAKYTYTFTLNTLVGKTFGTNLDDRLECCIWYQWGTTFGNTYVKPGVTAETWVGSGDTDVTQVQLCAGNEALPFQPKPFNQELLACQRYYQKSWNYQETTGSADTAPAIFFQSGTGTTPGVTLSTPLKVSMRLTTANYFHTYDTAGAIDRISTKSAFAGVWTTGVVPDLAVADSEYCLVSEAGVVGIGCHYTVDAEF